jgi:hypothetical protein
MPAPRKQSPGKKAMKMESKFLESKGKKQVIGVPTDKAKKVIKGHEMADKADKDMKKAVKQAKKSSKS